MDTWFQRLFTPKKPKQSWLRSIVSGTFYKVSDLRGSNDVESIKSQINVMRALANDSQVSTALAYYATDATTPNTSGDIIWATAISSEYQQVADIVNACFKRWNINNYARDHILELATQGNLYMPTTHIYRSPAERQHRELVSLDKNSIPDPDFDLVPSYMIPPEDIIHLWYRGDPKGYVYQSSDTDGYIDTTSVIMYPETSVIHFSLGGLLGKYHIDGQNVDGETVSYDIQFADPLMSQAVQPTKTLSLLEDAMLLSSLSRTVRFVNVECGDSGEEEEIREQLMKVKNMIEQQLSLNTANGDAQSYVNPQSPNNLIFIARVNGQDAISITDLQMGEPTESENKLLDYYQDKKLSVLGVPKEAMNFSSAEGLGGAGAVMSQRSALYANSLSRLETAYMNGWRDAFNKYFDARNMSGFKDKFTLHMNPIITNLDQILFEKRDTSLGQAQTITTILKDLGVTDDSPYKDAITEILTQAFPKTGAAVHNWNIDVTTEEGGDMGGGPF